MFNMTPTLKTEDQTHYNQFMANELIKVCNKHSDSFPKNVSNKCRVNPNPAFFTSCSC